MWFIGVEVEQETSAPPPKKSPGSPPAFPTSIIQTPLDICVKRTLGSVPLVSVLKGFDCNSDVARRTRFHDLSCARRKCVLHYLILSPSDKLI